MADLPLVQPGSNKVIKKKYYHLTQGLTDCHDQTYSDLHVAGHNETIVFLFVI